MHRLGRLSLRSLPLLVVLGGCSLDMAGTAEGDAGPELDAPANEQGDGSIGTRKPDGGARAMSDDGPELGMRDAGVGGSVVEPDAAAGSDPTTAAPVRPDDDAGNPSSPGVSKPPAFACAPGHFALRMELDVGWKASTFGPLPVIAAGSGLLTVQALARVEADGSATIAPCGLDIPEFNAAGNPLAGEFYKVFVPEAAWEAATMPRWSTSFQTSCADPSCTFSTGLLEDVIGARAKRPFLWPRPEARAQLMPNDDDGDGRPAVSAYTYREPSVNPKGFPYKPVPVVVAPSLVPLRISRFNLALGLRAQLDGKLENCDALTGRMTTGEFFGRAYGCRGIPEGGKAEVECNTDQTNTVDQFVPGWTTTSGRFRAVRISAATCSAVRAALPVVPPPAPPPAVP